MSGAPDPYTGEAAGAEPNVDLAQQLLDRCLPLREGSPGWRYLTETRGLPAEAVRYGAADLRLLEPAIGGFDRLAYGVVSLLRDRDGEVTGLAVEAAGPGGERVLDGNGRTARKTYALKKRGQIDALFRVKAAGQGAMVCYVTEGRLAKPLAIAAIIEGPAIYGWGGINGLGCCLPAEPTVVVVEDRCPDDAEAAERHTAAMERGADRLLLGGKMVLRVGGPPCGCCKDVDEALGKHPVEELRAWLTSGTEDALSLDGHARRCAKIKAPLKRAEAIADVIETFGLKKKGTTKGFRAQVDQYAGKRGGGDEEDGDAQERPDPVEDVIPWPEEVDGAEVLDAVVAVIHRHVNLPAEAADAAALWAAFTHNLDLFWFNPRLAICSPLMRCGKSTLVEVLKGLVNRAKSTSGVTPAVVFRMIEAWKPTYLIDEADGYLPANEELRSVLNSGHTRTGASIDRNVKDEDGNWVPVSFSTWCPLVVAGIGKLPGTLDDRSIKIRLQRKPRGVGLVRFRADRVAGITELGRKLARFMLDNQIRLGAADIEPPVELHDRAADNWRPILAVADAAGGTWPERARAAALALEKASMDEDDLCIELLADIHGIFALQPGAVGAIKAGDHEAAKAVRLFTSEIMKALHSMQERPWLECNHGKALSQRGLATLLRSFGIAPNTIRKANGTKTGPTAKGYVLTQFLEAFSSYLSLSGEPAVTPSQPAETLNSMPSHLPSHGSTQSGTPDSADGVPDDASECDGKCDGKKPRQTATCDGVTAGTRKRKTQKENTPHSNGADPDAAPAGTCCTYCGALLDGAPAEPTTGGDGWMHSGRCSAVDATPPEPAAKPQRKRSRIKGADTKPDARELPE